MVGSRLVTLVSVLARLFGMNAGHGVRSCERAASLAKHKNKGEGSRSRSFSGADQALCDMFWIMR